jgi:hypothetical protein
MSKIIAVVLTSIVGFFNSISFLPHIPVPSPSPVAIVSPTPASQPSEKALRIASYAWIRLSDAQKKDFRQKYGGKAYSLSQGKIIDITDTDVIREWAFAMDKDPALMAQNEAVMQKSMQQQGVQYNYISEPAQTYTQNTSGSNDSDYKLQKIENCQKETQTYNECVQGYNEKMADYSQCLAEASDPTSDRAVGFGRYASMSCLKPSNYCMKPISCY